MQKESRQIIDISALEHKNKKGVFLGVNQTIKIPFHTTETADNTNVERLLRVIGEVDIFWKWRQESGFPLHFYQSIEDSLDAEDAFGEKYSLKLTGKGEEYPRNAFIKIFRETIIPASSCRFEIFCKTDNLKIESTGDVLAELGIYLKKNNRHENDAYDAPDIIYPLNVESGTYGWQSLSTDFIMPEDAVLLLVRLGGNAFHGTVRFSSPALFQNNRDNCIPFLSPPNPRRLNYNYLGENLSKKEWPEFEIKVDNKPIFSGSVFNPIYRKPVVEIPLPDFSDKSSNHEVELTLHADYSSALPFILHGLEILEYSAGDFEIISFPDYVRKGETFPVLIKTYTQNLQLKISSDKEISIETEQILLKDPKHYIIRFKAKKAAIGINIKFSSPKYQEKLIIKQILEKKNDHILVATGDAVYVPQNTDLFLRYLEWYCKNNIGNAIIFRPVYRWSGTRELNKNFWQEIIPYLEKLNIFYSLMVDGRELPGKNANPPDSLLEGTHYLGRQAHENDGAFCYWDNAMPFKEPLPEPFADISSRSTDKGGIHPGTRPFRKGDKAYWFFDPEGASDMREASEQFTHNISQARAMSTRHTGPTTLFRYFYQAGYSTLGAEQMYGPEEITLAALRGASRAYGKKTYTSHLALQWSTTPHNTREHADRYFLSLATCYLQGVSQISTEEGLWRMENGFVGYDRFSESCLRHLECHKRFYNFTQSHERRGTLHVPMAVIQGRFDSWRCFARGNAWMQASEEWSFDKSEESYDLLNVFYPRSKLDLIYRSPCPVEPQGYYSGTPYGVVDITPIEAPLNILKQYRTLIFLGWNTYAPEEFKKLLLYVEQGGVLILAKPHITYELKKKNNTLIKQTKLLEELLGKGFSQTTGIIRKNRGNGKVIFFTADSYPAGAIRKEYENELKKAALENEKIERKNGWIHGSEDINFSVYNWPNSKTRTIYLLNINWWEQKTCQCTLLLHKTAFRIQVRPKMIETITICDGIAVMPLEDTVDIMTIKRCNDHIELHYQTVSNATILIFIDGQKYPIQHCIAAGIHKQKIGFK